MLDVLGFDDSYTLEGWDPLYRGSPDSAQNNKCQELRVSDFSADHTLADLMTKEMKEHNLKILETITGGANKLAKAFLVRKVLGDFVIGKVAQALVKKAGAVSLTSQGAGSSRCTSDYDVTMGLKQLDDLDSLNTTYLNFCAYLQ